MEESIATTRYFCHLCAQRVTPITDPDLKCPDCETGFIEEIDEEENQNLESVPRNLRSERAVSLWAPVLLGMMSNDESDPNPDRTRILMRPVRRERELDEDEDDEEGEDSDEVENEDEIDREIEDIFRRSRRRSAILQLLESLREDMREERERDRESLILINSSSEAIILQGGLDSDETGIDFGTGSIGDYFLGPGLDLLLQHLAENDPTRYGTPPAKKEIVEAMPHVKISEDLSCSVCLEDFEIGTEAKEMPCKHKFHDNCILPWLELHSSCPVCRYQLPGEERKEGTGDDSTGGNAGNDSLFSSWPFNGLFNAGSGSDSNPSSSSGPL